jgi:O-antigen ligase
MAVRVIVVVIVIMIMGVTVIMIVGVGVIVVVGVIVGVTMTVAMFEDRLHAGSDSDLAFRLGIQRLAEEKHQRRSREREEWDQPD